MLLIASRRKFTSRDLPLICFAAGLLFAFICLLTLTAPGNLKFEPRSSLISVSGTVQKIVEPRGRSSTTRIFLQTPTGSNILAVNYFADRLSVENVQPGDQVRALVQPDFARHLNWCWQLERGPATIIDYAQTLQSQQSEARLNTSLSLILGVFSITLLIAAILLRRRFGVWSADVDS